MYLPVEWILCAILFVIIVKFAFTSQSTNKRFKTKNYRVKVENICKQITK